jgi:hypothetical protein
MDVVKQITAAQLETIVNQQKDINALLTNIGIVESQKHGFLHQLADVNKAVEDYKNVLQEEYGPININLEDGTYTVIEDTAEEAK